MNTYRKLFAYIPQFRALALGAVLVSGLSAVLTTCGYYAINCFLYALIADQNMPRAQSLAFVIALFLLVGTLCLGASGLMAHYVGFLILDEIASSLDIDNEIKIQQSLTELVKHKTVIIISHRMKSIEHVDRIVVLKDGHVEACGTHAELMQISPTYQNLIEKTRAAEEFSY
ncbi:hypothetical protein [Fannyhessea vaginae]|uniref:hypothetical protein n=1 Tax=Fannyhessea vaginae TaxID=82135 RepID=UPI00288C3B9E|nr:hypothetical protein [Fannyhessea vaginae]